MQKAIRLRTLYATTNHTNKLSGSDLGGIAVIESEHTRPTAGAHHWQVDIVYPYGDPHLSRRLYHVRAVELSRELTRVT